MASISKAAADTGLYWSNVAAIAGAVFALLGILGAIYFGGIRDRYADSALEQLRPRHLTHQQRLIVIAKVRVRRWKQVEIIFHGTGEPETYARDLASTFEQAGATVNVHTLDPFIPYAWGLMVVETTTADSRDLKAILDEAGVACTMARTNDTVGQKDHPTLFVGTREDLGQPARSD